MRKSASFGVALLIWTGSAMAQLSGESVTKAPVSDSRLLNVRIEPLWLSLRELSLDIQVKMAPKLTIGPTIAYMKDGEGLFYNGKVADRFFYEDKTDRLSLGLRSYYYFKGVNQDSPYMSPSYTYSSATSKAKSTIFTERNETAKYTESKVGLTGGYQWIRNRISLNLGAGFEAYQTPKHIKFKGNASSYEYETDVKNDLAFTIDAGFGLRF